MVACLLKMLVNTGGCLGSPGLPEVTQAGKIQKHGQVTRWQNFYTKKRVLVSGITGGAILKMLPRYWVRRCT